MDWLAPVVSVVVWVAHQRWNLSYRCVSLPHAQDKISVTYCMCWAGHVKHHLQTALGTKLECTGRSSAFSSGGAQPCTFLLRIVEGG